MKVKRDKYDILFSKVIRTRDAFTCQRCQTQHAENSQGLHCSHFFSRRHQSTRYDPDNACSHCLSCHQYLGENPVIFQSWIRTYLGDVRYSELVFRHSLIKKWTKPEKAEMYQHFKGELKRLQGLRSEGRTGYIEVVAYE